MPPRENHTGVARKACLPCRRSKRRCDKKLPSCDLCIRKEVKCSYVDTASSESNPQLDGGAIQTQPLIVQSGPELNAAAIYLIAPRIFRQARLELPRLEEPIPLDVAALIGDATSIRRIAAKFFQTVHTWMPIISKRVFFTHLLNPLARRQSELNLLAVCMLLCSSTATDHDRERGAKTVLYQIAKRYYFEIEVAGALSVHVLQAAVLIALYEVGHAIYPAAYLTVGACARYGALLGIDKLGLDLMGDSLGPLPWIEVEERRRVWWAILLLDR
jgi:hypothetical protein